MRDKNNLKTKNQRTKIIIAYFQRNKTSTLHESQTHHSFVWFFPRLEQNLSYFIILNRWES